MSADSDFAEIKRRARLASCELKGVATAQAVLRAFEHLGYIEAIASAQVMLAELAAREANGCAGCCDVDDCQCTKVCDETYCDKHFKEEYHRRFARAPMDAEDKKSDWHERMDGES